MKVGVLTVRLRLSSPTSLKEKRSILKHLVAGIRHKFNVSVAEIDHHDDKRTATLGIACVSNDGRFVHRLLSKVESHCNGATDCSVEQVLLEVWP